MRSDNRSGHVGGTGIIVTVLLVTLAVLVFPVWSSADRALPGPVALDTPDTRSVPAPYGPLSGLDREFVTGERLSGLWELPAAQQAQQRGTTPAVRTAGLRLVEGHTFLDARVRSVAARLGVDLPNQPDGRQRRWLSALGAAHGTRYDVEFASILRAAQGRTLTLVAQVRAFTRNTLVRELADDANTIVLGHMRALEATGYADPDAPV
ncbi:DUF4142 domain-containing protein [Streptomyces sp. NPDC127038]|uniref:DUF4142 domain-containing protein n=1 Tax=Streptomyces sp. NPDC127038 TaxID=3347114 RepID=UPI003660373A